MIKSIPLDAKIECTDGSGGDMVSVIVDPASHAITHIVVLDPSYTDPEERLVPLDKVVDTTHDRIHLNCTRAELSEMPKFIQKHYMQQIIPGYGQIYSQPYLTMASEPVPLESTEEIIPRGEFSLHRGAAVEAVDGHVGHVGDLLIDPANGEITHFILLAGHWWDKKEIALPVSVILKVDRDLVQLKINQDEIKLLPSIPVHRSWKDLHATDLELLTWVFTQQNQAEKILQSLMELAKQDAIELLYTCVLQKGPDGKLSLHETKAVDLRHNVIIGAVAGGLAGLLVGPVAAAAAATAAGAAAGKHAENNMDVGFTAEQISSLNQQLAPGSSALVVLVEYTWLEAIQTNLASAGGNFSHNTLAFNNPNPGGEKAES
jgi:uncharacterized membrane protein